MYMNMKMKNVSIYIYIYIYRVRMCAYAHANIKMLHYKICGRIPWGTQHLEPLFAWPCFLGASSIRGSKCFFHAWNFK